MTLRYAHLAPEQLAHAAARIKHRFESVASNTTKDKHPLFYYRLTVKSE